MFYRFLFIFPLFALLFCPAVIIAEERIPIAEGKYNLKVSFDIPNSKIIGRAKIFAQKDKELIFHTGLLTIRDVQLNGDKIEFDARQGVLKILPHRDGIVEIAYEGIFKEDSLGRETKHGIIRNIIDERGISLTGIWYPYMPGLFKYSLSVLLPEGYEAVSEAERIEKTLREGFVEFFFDFPHPVDGINLIATNRYEIIKDYYKDIEIYAYFFQEDIGFARTYIEYAKKYLKLYEDILGGYPYKRFSIVENFLPTGYSMPTFTLLGQAVVRLPFIVETSLGHEILHQWFGNLVYVDYDKGNWSEGITTYLADHLYEELKGKGWQYRKQMLINYRSYVYNKNEFLLRDFRARVDFPSRAIGYGKAMMVFHMLKDLVGEDVFYESLRDFIDEQKFQRASWNDIKKAFEKIYGKDLGWFFEQWIDKKGLPDLNIENVKIRQRGSKYEVSFDIVQKAKVYIIDVPVTVHYSDGNKTRKSFRIDKERNTFRMILSEEPERIIMDEDYDIARSLSDEEFPPVIARLIGAEKIIIAPPVSNKDAYKNIINTFERKGGIKKEPQNIKYSDIKNASLIILGGDNPMIERLYGKVNIADVGFNLTIKENPLNNREVIGIFSAKSKEESVSAFRKIFHYGKYSDISFEMGRNIFKHIEESRRGINMWQREQAAVINVAEIKTLSDVIESVSGKRIIYVGETHGNFAHHAVQLDVIKGLHRKGRQIAIGMEMFQRPFQGVLDSYIAGKINEREFLKKSEYFKRWGMDYNFYKPIVDFARSKQIPIVALNISREIIRKVRIGGIDSLSEDEKNLVPLLMDFSDNEYRERLREVFDRHDFPNGEFEYFHQAQILWDEAMAMSAYEFLKENTGYQMVVLAGSGHLSHASGIPQRVYRRNGYDYAIILSDAAIEENIADYIIYPKPVEGITAPKLMVFLSEEDGSLKITRFAENSVSEKAGLKEGDIIVSLDGIAVSSTDDVRIHLTFKEKGESVTVRVIRNRFLAGEREMEFEVVL